MSPQKVVCMSHMEDPDGLVSASLIKQVYESKTYLVKYENFIEKLENVITTEHFDHIFICDLEIKPQNKEKVLELFKKIIDTNKEIYFIDHHFIDENFKSKMISLNVKLSISEVDCTSAIIYDMYKDRLKGNSALITACACITDNLENGNIAKEILEHNDKMFTYVNSSLIWYYISSLQHNEKGLYEIVDLFYQNKKPIQIPDIFEKSRSVISKIGDSLVELKDKIKDQKNYTCLEINDNQFSNAAVKTLTLSDKSVVLIYKKYKKNSNQMVLLANNDFKPNLGLIINELAMKFQGTGGGDPKKCAAIIPMEYFEEFRSELDERLDE